MARYFAFEIKSITNVLTPYIKNLRSYYVAGI